MISTESNHAESVSTQSPSFELSSSTATTAETQSNNLPASRSRSAAFRSANSSTANETLPTESNNVSAASTPTLLSTELDSIIDSRTQTNIDDSIQHNPDTIRTGPSTISDDSPQIEIENTDPKVSIKVSHGNAHPKSQISSTNTKIQAKWNNVFNGPYVEGNYHHHSVHNYYGLPPPPPHPAFIIDPNDDSKPSDENETAIDPHGRELTPSTKKYLMSLLEQIMLYIRGL